MAVYVEELLLLRVPLPRQLNPQEGLELRDTSVVDLPNKSSGAMLVDFTAESTKSINRLVELRQAIGYGRQSIGVKWSGNCLTRGLRLSSVCRARTRQMSGTE
jgi:hypothetical protein